MNIITLSFRARRLLPLFAAALLVLDLGFCGCSAKNDPTPKSYTQGERTALASDSPYLVGGPGTSETTDYDPWESFNAQTFDFNFNVLDRYGLKPAAKVWADVLPEPVRHGLGNVFDNIAMPRRFVNKLVQGRWPGAGAELVRFVLNSTAGLAGFFDVASRVGIEKSDADTGQSLGVYGIKPGPYLVLPVLQPLTVRDAIGYAADSFMDPLSWFVTPLLADVGRGAAYTINQRADNMELYDDVEDSSLDLYAAVRNGYLQRRQRAIEDAIRDRDRFWSFTGANQSNDSVRTPPHLPSRETLDIQTE